MAEQKVPGIGDYFVREVPPSDNVSALLCAEGNMGADFHMRSLSERVRLGRKVTLVMRSLEAQCEGFLGMYIR